MIGAHHGRDDLARADGRALRGARRQGRIGRRNRRCRASDARAQRARRPRVAAGARHRRHRRRRRLARSTSRPPRRSSSRAAACRSPSTATAPPRASAAAPTCWKRWASRSNAIPNARRACCARRASPFLFAQRHHPAMRAVGPVRSELGVRTIFNVLGPLDESRRREPAVVGVAEERHLVLLGGGAARARRRGGRGRALGQRARRDRRRGTDVRRAVRCERHAALDASPRRVRRRTHRSRASAAATPPFNAAALTAILAGERSPRADLVALNAALALVVAGAAADIAEGMERARTAIAERCRAGSPRRTARRAFQGGCP